MISVRFVTIVRSFIPRDKLAQSLMDIRDGAVVLKSFLVQPDRPGKIQAIVK